MQSNNSSFEFTLYYILNGNFLRPITVAARSNALTVFARSNAEIVGSNPLEAWMSVCVYSVFVLSCV
jgi:pyruvate carboxylase